MNPKMAYQDVPGILRLSLEAGAVVITRLLVVHAGLTPQVATAEAQKLLFETMKELHKTGDYE